MPLKDYSTRDKYTYPNSPVLINLKDLKDGEKLEQFEANAVFFRSAQLILRPVLGRFDLEHLQAIHRHLFQDVYAWAGELRTVNITKGESTFGFAQYIEGHLRTELNKLARENMLIGLERAMFEQRLAYFFAEINAAHPFREGNGRAQREFIRELALFSGHRVDWAKGSREAMYSASVESLRGNLAPLVHLLADALQRG